MRILSFLWSSALSSAPRAAFHRHRSIKLGVPNEINIEHLFHFRQPFTLVREQSRAQSELRARDGIQPIAFSLQRACRLRNTCTRPPLNLCILLHSLSLLLPNCEGASRIETLRLSFSTNIKPRVDRPRIYGDKEWQNQLFFICHMCHGYRYARG